MTNHLSRCKNDKPIFENNSDLRQGQLLIYLAEKSLLYNFYSDCFQDEGH